MPDTLLGTFLIYNVFCQKYTKFYHLNDILPFRFGSMPGFCCYYFILSSLNHIVEIFVILCYNSSVKLARYVNFYLFSPGFVPGLFHLTKDLNMQRVTYIYSGETQTFYFNFPYIEKSNIVVTVDGKPAPAYNVIGVKGGLNKDFPFSSGKIVFVKPLKMFQTITIERHMPYNRPVDFQPTAKITSMDLNLDMNNTLELLKDLKDEVDDLRNKYKDITDKEKIDNLLEKIELVNQNIAKFAEEIAKLDGISDIFDDIDDLQESVSSINESINNLDESITTANNNIDTINETINLPNKWCYLPSNKYIDLNVQNGGTYVAPDNGYIWLQAGQNPNTQLYVDILDTSGNLIYGDGAILDYGCVFIPITKGNTALIKYTAKQFLRFVYAVSAI